MAPILVQEVAHIEDIEGQFDGIDLTSHLEAELLTEVNIEVMLESQVVSITLAIVFTVEQAVDVIKNIFFIYKLIF